MAAKTDFTPEEWNEVLGSVMMAGMAVTLADPSGLIGMTKEGLASGSALVAAKTDPQANALIKSIVSDFETSEGRAAARAVQEPVCRETDIRNEGSYPGGAWSNSRTG